MHHKGHRSLNFFSVVRTILFLPPTVQNEFTIACVYICECFNLQRCKEICSFTHGRPTEIRRMSEARLIVGNHTNRWTCAEQHCKVFKIGKGGSWKLLSEGNTSAEWPLQSHSWPLHLSIDIICLFDCHVN